MTHRLHILIVEDDTDTRESLRDVLEIDEHQITTCASVSEALALENQLSRMDVLLLDRNLPEGVAERYLPKLRALAPDADVIVITGFADMEGTIAAFREGVTDYLIKPVNPESLRVGLDRIAKKRRMERELLEERQFADLVLRTAEAIVLVLDVDGKILRFNRYLRELTGVHLEDVLHEDWFERFIPERDRVRIRDLFERTVREVESRGVVNPILTSWGTECEVRWSNTTIKNAEGAVVGVLSVGLDISDLMRAQQQLVHSERLAAIGQTMAGVAHESRNALQRIQTAVELLEDEIGDDPGARKDLEKIERASADLRDLLEEVRSYAAPIHLDCQAASITRIWRRAWDSLETRRRHRDIEFLEQRRPEGDVELWVDEKKLEQVFRNLFENTLDACSDPVQILIRSFVDQDRCHVIVEDNGPGFDPSWSPKIFDPFFTTKPTGTGLGLAIVHRIIESHGGTVCSQPCQHGARIELQIPIHRRGEPQTV